MRRWAFLNVWTLKLNPRKHISCEFKQCGFFLNSREFHGLFSTVEWNHCRQRYNNPVSLINAEVVTMYNRNKTAGWRSSDRYLTTARGTPKPRTRPSHLNIGLEDQTIKSSAATVCISLRPVAILNILHAIKMCKRQG